MVLHIDTDRMEALGLTDREMWLYLTLTILCTRKPWKGSDEELAEKCKNHMSRVTIMRLKKSLKEKGLIMENEDGISPVPNKHESVQNDHKNVQDEQNSKEKRTKKENVETKIENKKACEYIDPKHAPDDFMEIININQPPHYTYPDYYRVAIESGYLNPKPLADGFRDYYNDHGWPPNRDKLRMFRTWLNNEKRFETGRKPTLTEDERLVLLTFVDKLPKRLMQHFSEQLRRLELTPDKITFFVDKEIRDKFYQWMIDIKATEILAAYNRKIYVRPA